jgi:hypothetical protein
LHGGDDDECTLNLYEAQHRGMQGGEDDECTVDELHLPGHASGTAKVRTLEFIKKHNTDGVQGDEDDEYAIDAVDVLNVPGHALETAKARMP